MRYLLLFLVSNYGTNFCMQNNETQYSTLHNPNETQHFTLRNLNQYQLISQKIGSFNITEKQYDIPLPDLIKDRDLLRANLNEYQDSKLPSTMEYSVVLSTLKAINLEIMNRLCEKCLAAYYIKDSR